MMHVHIRSGALPLLMMVLAVFAGCDGRSNKVGAVGSGRRAQLLSVEIGRLVDIYSYQRIDPAIGDRRLRTNRRLELFARNVVVNANIESQSLFQAGGGVSATANYEFLPFDKNVGREQLLILWDNREGPEAKNFENALANARGGLAQLPPSFRGQNTLTNPIPIVPRNAAIKLRFSTAIDVDQGFFLANPSAVQLLEFKGDPAVVQPVDAFRILPCRVLPIDDTIVLDTTILGGEAEGGVTSPGLPLSSDNITANIRIAIPVRGAVSPALQVGEDPVGNLNGVDSAGRRAVIRDFRSGNIADGAAGRLREPEPPVVVANLAMGITAIDTAQRVLTINKRNRFVPVRARYPFVDGPLTPAGIPLGPSAVPTQRALRSGDFLTQVVQVQLSNGTFEAVTLRAEILENLEVFTAVGDPQIGFAKQPPPGDSQQGELLPVIRLRVASLAPARDSEGREVSFQANTLPEGQDCAVRVTYVERLPLTGSNAAITDRTWRNLFPRIEPVASANAPGVDVSPNATLSVEFSKPMDLDQIDNTKNLLVTNTPISQQSFAAQMTDPKRATTRVVPTRLSDLLGDGTVIRLQPPLGFFHAAGQAEAYSFHVRTGPNGVIDLAGNPLELYDDVSAPQGSWSVDFSLRANADPNLVAWHTWLFEAEDEDGTLPGSVDLFGQFRIENGRLLAASGVRFGRSADNNNLGTISRINRGECWDSRDPPIPTANSLVPPLPGQPADSVPINPAPPPTPHPGLLYWNPRVVDSIGPLPAIPAPQVFPFWQTLAQPVGRVIEPLVPQGSRMQMRYIEDDFSLNYRQPSDFMLDVEQLYWSPFSDETVSFDVFDRVSMSLAHARTRPDERWYLFLDTQTPPVAWCVMACSSTRNGLSTQFASNVLEGTAQTPVFQDVVYTINPNAAFRVQSNTFVPFPRFDRSYTWRDSRLVTVDAAGQVIGLGGALQPNAQPPNDDTTANIDSPWITDVPDPEFVTAGNAIWVLDPADFVGTNQRDHDPIALPLLVDIKVFPDGAANGVASGTNGFQVATLGPPTAGFPGFPGGYYDQVGSGCQPPWSRLRVHATGSFQPPVLIDPANQLQAQASVLKDAGLGNAATGLFTAPPGDGMLHWSRADFVRRVSTMTFGFFDTLQPQRAVLLNQAGVPTPESGFPNLLALDPLLRPTDLVVQADPPQARQPAGTSVVIELRGADDFGNSGVLYNPTFAGGTQFPANDTFDQRGNLLNPNYSCEAYRYSTANVAGAPRVAAERLTRYVTDNQIDLIRNPATNLLPRFLNLRIVMVNNVDVTPSLSPSLRSLAVVYRLAPGQ